MSLYDNTTGEAKIYIKFDFVSRNFDAKISIEMIVQEYSFVIHISFVLFQLKIG